MILIPIGYNFTILISVSQSIYITINKYMLHRLINNYVFQYIIIGI